MEADLLIAHNRVRPTRLDYLASWAVGPSDGGRLAATRTARSGDAAPLRLVAILQGTLVAELPRQGPNREVLPQWGEASSPFIPLMSRQKPRPVSRT